MVRFLCISLVCGNYIGRTRSISVHYDGTMVNSSIMVLKGMCYLGYQRDHVASRQCLDLSKYLCVMIEKETLVGSVSLAVDKKGGKSQ